jgi:hypothetical protein
VRFGEARNGLVIVVLRGLGVGANGKRKRKVLGRRVAARDDPLTGFSRTF